MKSHSGTAAETEAAVEVVASRSSKNCEVVVPPLPNLPVLSPSVPPPSSRLMADAKIAHHFATRRQLQIHPLSPVELQRLKVAFQGGIPIHPPQLSDLRSLIFRLTSQGDLSERQRSALEDVAHRLPLVFQAYSAASNTQVIAQDSLDRLNVLQAEHTALLDGYDRQVSVRQSFLAEEETARHRIGEIGVSLGRLQTDLKVLQARRGAVTDRQKQIAVQQSRVFHRSKPLRREFQESRPQQDLALFDRDCGQEAMRSAAASWEGFRLRLSNASAVETPTASVPGPVIRQVLVPAGE